LKNEEVKQVVSQVIQEIQFSGPIPPPNIISGYEKILPGAADRILAMAEKQSEHRQEMEKKMVEAESRDGLLGIICGFTLGVGCIAAAIIMTVTYPESVGVISGAVLGGTGVVSIAGTAIKSTRSNKKDE
jgi:uncharacterized membrane protein